MSTRANPHFDIDLAFGLSRESQLRVVLGDDLLEMKSHPSAPKTGNVFIEVEQGNGAPGGISVTHSKWWANEVEPETIIIQRTSKVRALTDLARDKWGLVMCGCGCGNRGVLVPVLWLVQPWRAVAA